MKRRRPAACPIFDFHELVLDMQKEVRSRCLPSERSMLALTCKAEWETASQDDRESLLFRLAFEGDQHGYLRAVLSRLNQRHKYALRSDVLPATMGPRNRDPHKLVHAAIRGKQLALVQWFYESVQFDRKSCFDKCVELAVRTDDHELVYCVTQQVIIDEKKTEYVLIKGDDMGDMDPGISVRLLLTDEAIRANNVPLLMYLQQVGLLEAHTNLFVIGKPIPDEDRLACAMDWIDAFRFVLPLRTDEHSRREIAEALCCSLIYRQWDMEEILKFVLNEIPDVDVHNFWMVKRIFSCGLRHKHKGAVGWAWPHCCAYGRQPWNHFEYCWESIDKFADQETSRTLLTFEALRGIDMSGARANMVRKLWEGESIPLV